MNNVLLLITLFLIKAIFARKSVKDILLKRYGRVALSSYRKLERTTIQLTKCNLDLDFLILCKTYNVIPRFLNFNLYRSELKKIKIYKDFQRKLLTNEINDKRRKIKLLNHDLENHRLIFTESILSNSLFENLFKYYFLNLIEKTNRNIKEKFSSQQMKKLHSLGITNKLCPVNPEDVIFNFSSIQLTDREKFLLALGLNFNLPVYKINSKKYFLAFEKMLKILKDQNLSSTYNFNNVIDLTKSIANKFYYKFKPYKIFNPVINKDDIRILKNLSRNKNIVICKPDKGRGVVILDRIEYDKKMTDIIDTNKFKPIQDDPLKLSLRIEDKINYVINQANKYLKTRHKEPLKNVKPSGTTPGKMYGLPKIHKNNHPLKPVLAAYNTASYRLAQWLVSILSPFSLNDYTLRNSYDFTQQVKELNLNLDNVVLVSYDVTSLFTNIPIDETIDLIINSIYLNIDTFHDLPKNIFKNLLKSVCKQSYFFFNNKIYLQTDGVSMGSPIGPLMANFFMNFLEVNFLQNCPLEFKPLFYRRYVDDTFTLFNSIEEANKFLEYINQQHPNIKFTIESENNKKLPFLDTLLSKTGDKLDISIYRKKPSLI